MIREGFHQNMTNREEGSGLLTQTSSSNQVGSAVLVLCRRNLKISFRISQSACSVPLALRKYLKDLHGTKFANKNRRSPHAQNISVKYTTVRNIYTYDSRKLMISYGIALLATTIALCFGFYAFFDNGVVHSTAFSAIPCDNEKLEVGWID